MSDGMKLQKMWTPGRSMRVNTAVKILAGKPPRRRWNQSRSFEDLFADAPLALETFRVLWKQKRKDYALDEAAQRIVNEAWNTVRKRLERSLPVEFIERKEKPKRDRREYMREYMRQYNANRKTNAK